MSPWEQEVVRLLSARCSFSLLEEEAAHLSQDLLVKSLFVE